MLSDTRGVMWRERVVTMTSRDATVTSSDATVTSRDALNATRRDTNQYHAFDVSSFNDLTAIDFN
jgi:hypothetical protein